MAPILIQHHDEWDSALLQLPGAHLLQSWTWGALKSRYGWQAECWLWQDEAGSPIAAAQVLYRSIAGGLTMAYCPRGPLLRWDQREEASSITKELTELVRKKGAFFLKMDPAIPMMDDKPPEAGLDFNSIHREFLASGWVLSDEQVQFRNTLILDLTPDKDAILAGMKQKTRYNIRLAERRGVTVRRGSPDDMDLVYRLYAETSLRDGFVIRPPGYYQDAWGMFMERELASIFIAEAENKAIAALVAYRFGNTAYYLYGMSSVDQREKMPNHLLQWEAIRWAKNTGCTIYDFWGAPHDIQEEDPMYGVYRFKTGFGAELVRTQGAWDYALKPVAYRLYTSVMPRLLGVMRAAGRLRTRLQNQDL